MPYKEPPKFSRKVSRILPITILIYLGLTLIIMPYFNIGLGNVPYEMVNTFGVLLIVTGIVWFFQERLQRKIDGLLCKRIALFVKT